MMVDLLDTYTLDIDSINLSNKKLSKLPDLISDSGKLCSFISRLLLQYKIVIVFGHLFNSSN